MELIFIALLAGKTLLPSIDRQSLDLQARAEALAPSQNAARAPNVVRASSRLTVRRASSGTTLGLGSITTICRAAGSQDDPTAFVARLSRAYSLSADETVSLRSSCAAYLAGSADARRNSGR